MSIIDDMNKKFNKTTSNNIITPNIPQKNIQQIKQISNLVKTQGLEKTRQIIQPIIPKKIPTKTIPQKKNLGDNILDYWKILGGKSVGGITNATAGVLGIPRMVKGLVTGQEIAPTGLEAVLKSNGSQFDTMANDVIGNDKAKKTFGDLTNIIAEQVPTLALGGFLGKGTSIAAKAAMPLLTKTGTMIATKAPTIANIATNTVSAISKAPVVGKMATAAVKAIPEMIGQNIAFGGKSGVSYYDTAREITDDPNKIRAYTLAGVGAEGVPEALEFNMLQNTVKAVSKKNPILGTIGSVLLQGFVNAGQEAATTGLTEIANQKILDQAPNLNIKEDMLRDGAYGFAIGMIMTGSGKGLNSLQNKINSGQHLNDIEVNQGIKLIEQETGKSIADLTNDEMIKNPNYLKEYINKSKQIENTQNIDKSKSIPTLSKMEYINLNGGANDSRVDILKTSKYVSERQKQQVGKNIISKNAENSKLVTKLTTEYDNKILNGDIVAPTKIETLIQTANGHEDLSSTQAARRLLIKKGINWDTTEQYKPLYEKEDIKSLINESKTYQSATLKIKEIEDKTLELSKMLDEQSMTAYDNGDIATSDKLDAEIDNINKVSQSEISKQNEIIKDETARITAYQQSFGVKEKSIPFKQELKSSVDREKSILTKELPIDNENLISLDKTIPQKDIKNSFIPSKSNIINKISTNSETIKQIEDNKNDSIKSIDNKIQDKMFELIQKKNQDTKTATNIKNQIELLEKQKKDITIIYNSKIDNLNNKNDKLSTPEAEMKDTRNDKSKEYRNIAKGHLSTLADWKDKSFGWLYERETMERNFRDVVKNPIEAEKLVDTYITPIDKSEADKQTFMNDYNSKIQDLKLTNKEAIATQMLGELKYNKETQLSLETVDNYIKDNKVDRLKIDNSVEVFRNIYDELFTTANAKLKEQGYKEIPYRKGYFPHFTEQKAQNVISKFAEKLGFKVDTSDLPTDIAGITWQLKPGKTWFGNSMQRTGDTTDYNVLKGFDNYIRGASDVIFHTENIQKLRALENEIRYQYAEQGIKDQINEIEARDISSEEKSMLLDELYSKIHNGMPNLVSEIRSYTDSLANKKDIHDRGAEKSLNRSIYNTANALQSRVAANMVGMNLSSAMTNFIPITQAWSNIGTTSLTKGVTQTMQAILKDDGFTNRSVFLTNRNKQAERLFKTKIDKISDGAGLLFKAVDSFSSNVIVRGKYNDNIKKGMSEQQAMLNADKFADGVMAGRSKGSLPTQFNKKNPVAKLFNMFQLEVNNQFSFAFKDLPRDKKNEVVTALIWAFAKMCIGAWVYNEVAERTVGRRPAPDPIHFIASSIKTIADKDTKVADKVLKIGTEVVSQAPFIGGILGGGRIPISAALPDGEKTLRATTGLITGEMDSNKALTTLGKELTKPLAYLLPPFGGGQIKKTIEGISTINKGGEYGIDSEGKETLKFPVENPNAGDYIKAGLFGKYALPLAKDYVDSGFKTLTAKETQGYKDTGIPFKEFKQYAFAKLTKNADKLDIIKNMKIDDDKKFEMYKFDIFSDQIRKEDNSSQLLDAEFAIKNGVDKKEYMDLYDLSQKENTSMPTIKKLTEIFDNKSSLKNYVTFKTATSENKMPTDKDEFGNNIEGNKKNKVRDYLINSSMSDKDKQFLYSQSYEGNIVEYSKAKTKLANVKQFNSLDSKSQSEILETVSNYYDEKDPKTKLKSLQLDWQKEAKDRGIPFSDYESYRNAVENINPKGNTNAEVTANWLRNNDTLDAAQRKWIYTVDSKNRTNTSAKLKVAELSGLDVAKYVTYNKAISDISGKDSTGKTVTNLRKNSIIKYVESLPLKAVEKALILYSNNIEVKQYRSSVAKYVSGLDLDVSNKKYILENIGYDIVDNKIQW